MRTTMNLDDDLYRRAKAAAAQRGCSVTSIVEEALHLALAAADARPSFAGLPVAPEGGGLQPGVDLHDSRALRALMDEGRPVDALR
jgi:plasmid stability protein